MNKTTNFLISIILLLSGYQSLMAQDATTKVRKYNEYGFRMGINYSDIDFADDAIVPTNSNEARFGFMAGFFAIFHFTETISLQPEIQYSAQGEKFTSASDSNGILGQFDEDELKINLIQVPVLLNYTIVNKFVISAGPQIGLNIWEWERAGDYEHVQLSAIGGVAYKFTDNFSVALRASLGLTNALDADNSDSFEVNSALNEPLFVATGTNHYVQLSLAYQL